VHAGGIMNDHSTLLNALAESPMYRRYEKAFSSATGLPLALRSREGWQPTFRGKPQENAFCAMMARTNAGCAACLRMQERISDEATHETATMKCHFGLTESAVPVKLGTETIGFLATGQILTQVPTDSQLSKMEQTMKLLGVEADPKEARKAYMDTKVMPRMQFASATRLLEIFAEDLSARSNQLAVREANADPIAVVRAKAYIRENLQEDITLADVAKAACTSTFYICKLFKRHTGVNLMEYISRLRVERAKELLVNPQLRISEIAFEVGFQSLTHFNRVFRALVGESPTEYRDQIATPLAA
jgi:AraC-like DNA-binding protein/ligand-binding sensor protein